MSKSPKTLASQSGWDMPLQNPQNIEAPAMPANLPAENTAQLQRGRPFAPGVSGNPAGRPRGAKNKLTETFISVVENDFAEHGQAALEKLRDDDTAAYIRIVASLIPRDIIAQREREPDYASLEFKEMVELIERVRRHEYVRITLQKERR